MVSLREKAKIKKAGNLNQCHSYVIITVLSLYFEKKYTPREVPEKKKIPGN